MGVKAYAAARRMAREANDFGSMRYWGAVQKAIARRTDMRLSARRVGPFLIFERPTDASCDAPTVNALHPSLERAVAATRMEHASRLARFERRAARAGS